MAKHTIKIGIVGGTGYTGVELLRLLVQHPHCELAIITSRKEAGMAVSDMFPNLRGRVALKFTEPSREALARCDLVFFATPNGVSMNEARAVLEETRATVESADDARATFTLRVAESALEYTDDRFGPSHELITEAYRDGIFAGDDQRLRLAHMWHGELLSVADRSEEICDLRRLVVPETPQLAVREQAEIGELDRL